MALSCRSPLPGWFGTGKSLPFVRPRKERLRRAGLRLAALLALSRECPFAAGASCPAPLVERGASVRRFARAVRPSAASARLERTESMNTRCTCAHANASANWNKYKTKQVGKRAVFHRHCACAQSRTPSSAQAPAMRLAPPTLLCFGIETQEVKHKARPWLSGRGLTLRSRRRPKGRASPQTLGVSRCRLRELHTKATPVVPARLQARCSRPSRV